MSETFECPKFGYQWKQGQHGGHSCSDRLLKQLKDAKIELNSVLVDWNAIVSASGSKTHVGAVGHFAQMRTELEAVKDERDALRARIEAAEKQEPFGYLIDFGQSKIFTDSHPVASAWDDFVAVYSMPPMPSQRDRLPDDWEENIYNAMDEAFKLGKFADGGMQNDDTQIGVEFAVRHFKKMLENKNG